MEIGRLMNCQNNLITEKCPAGTIMDHIFCWAGMNLLRTQGDIKLNECFSISFTFLSLTLVTVRLDSSLIIL